MQTYVNCGDIYNNQYTEIYIPNIYHIYKYIPYIYQIYTKYSLQLEDTMVSEINQRKNNTRYTHLFLVYGEEKKQGDSIK